MIETEKIHRVVPVFQRDEPLIFLITICPSCGFGGAVEIRRGYEIHVLPLLREGSHQSIRLANERDQALVFGWILPNSPPTK